MDYLEELLEDYSARKQGSLLQLKKGTMERERFLEEAKGHIAMHFSLPEEEQSRLLVAFEQYIFGYSILTPLIDDPEISDIRVISYTRIRVKRAGQRMDAGIAFASEKEYRQFVDAIAARNQVNISHLNAIQRFTDTQSHPGYILRFTISMPLLNAGGEPYLCIRKIPRQFPGIRQLIDRGVLTRELAELLIMRFGQGSTLICGGNSSGKTTLLNALKETLPDHMAVLVSQQAEELTTALHPDMMFLHSLPGTGESQVHYDLKDISIAGLTMDVDFFIIGEVKGGEAMYLLNAAYTGQLCAATIHAPSADKAPDKLVDYALYESKYTREELMGMLDCFHTLIFMQDYHVQQIFACKGWDREARCLIMEKLYEHSQMTERYGEG